MLPCFGVLLAACGAVTQDAGLSARESGACERLSEDVGVVHLGRAFDRHGGAILLGLPNHRIARRHPLGCARDAPAVCAVGHDLGIRVNGRGRTHEVPLAELFEVDAHADDALCGPHILK